jgi:hypothetical protein
MKRYYFLLILVISLLSAHAQSPDLNLVVVNNDRVNGGTIEVKLQIKSDTAFDIGSSNFRIAYNAAAVSYSSVIFNVDFDGF